MQKGVDVEEERFEMAEIHVNVPYPMLKQRIDFVVENRIHPEIYFGGKDLDSVEEEDVKKLGEVLQRHGLEVTLHGPFMDLSPGGVDPKIKQVTRDRFMQTIEWAAILKSKSVVFHPGYANWLFDGNVDLWLQGSLDTWIPLVEKARRADLVLAIENVYEEGPDSILLLLNRIRSPHFRFCFDTGHHHAFSGRKVSLERWIGTLKDYLWEVHLHDNHSLGDEHLPVGEGDFDFDRFFRFLAESGLKPIYTIEPHREEHLWPSLKMARKWINTP